MGSTLQDQEERSGAPGPSSTRNGVRSSGGRMPSGVLERFGSSPAGTAAKLLFLSIVDIIGLIGLWTAFAQGAWVLFTVVLVTTILLNVVYLRKDLVPLKYLIPGTIFLLAFQVYPVLYTFYLSFTNYQTGNFLEKPSAIEQIESQAFITPEDAPRYEATPFGTDDEVALLLTNPETDARFLGTADGLTPLDEAGDVQRDGEQVTVVGDYERLDLREAQDRQAALQDLRIPVEEGEGEGDEGGEISLITFTSAQQREPRYQYVDDRDVVVDQQTGTEFTPIEGTFTADDGSTLQIGYRVPVGLDNYAQIFTSQEIRGPFLRVFVWNYAFAFLSVVTTFALGLLLALALNKPGMRGLRTYRVLMIFPYALPSFLTALIWAGLLNTSFGAVNQDLLFGASIPWLDDPWWARGSVLLVNLWLGFPYMFIIILGTLQSIPNDLVEASYTDGATQFQAFRRIIMPLLFVAVAPILIASFAFNFNNFNLIFLLTDGGPPIPGAQTPAGNTDILISYVYKLAFEAGRGAQRGFAAAISVVIFLMVAAITAWSFRYTKALEDIN